jgi:hypothetical protein
MTHEQLADFHETHDRYQALEKEAAETKELYYTKLRTCDHLQPDGTSAWRDAWLFSICTICSASDDI